MVINDPNLNRLNERYISKQKFLSRYYACVASLYHHYVNHQIKMKTMNANIDNVLLLEAGRGSLSQLSLSLKQSPHNDIIAQWSLAICNIARGFNWYVIIYTGCIQLLPQATFHMLGARRNFRGWKATG